VLTSPPRSVQHLYNTVAMSRLGDCIDIDSGLHPTARAHAAFFIPTPPTDEDLLLFSSAAVFSPPAADPLLPWLTDLATRRLSNAVVVGRELRHLLHESKNPRGDPQRPVTTPPPAVSPVPAASSEMPACLSASRSTGGPSTAARSRDAGASLVLDVGASADRGDATRVVFRRDPNQVICRGLRSVDELMLAWEEGYNGYMPIKNFKKGKSGKLDRAQINLLSKAYGVWRKVNAMGREEFRMMYELPVNGVAPTLTDIRVRIERENRSAKKRTADGIVKNH